MLEKVPYYEEKIDVQTNNPRRLFRALADFFEDELSKRGYAGLRKNEPALAGTGISGVAEFKGILATRKIYKERSKKQLIFGIIIMAIAIFFYFLPLESSFGVSPFFKIALWAVPAVIAIIIILLKKSIGLVIVISMRGESYQYKGNKQTTKIDIEKRERLDVVSDVRIKLVGEFTSRVFVNEKHQQELKSDMRFIYDNLNKIVPEYRIPT